MVEGDGAAGETVAEAEIREDDDRVLRFRVRLHRHHAAPGADAAVVLEREDDGSEEHLLALRAGGDLHPVMRVSRHTLVLVEALVAAGTRTAVLELPNAPGGAYSAAVPLEVVDSLPLPPEV